MNYAILTPDPSGIERFGTARDLWPGVSHPSTDPADDWLAEHNAVRIRSDLPHNPETHYLRRTAPYLLDGEVFNMEVVEREPEPEPVPEPQWIAFGDAVMADPGVNLMLGAALQNAPGLYGGLTVGLGKAADGDSRVFTRAWAAALAVGLVTPKLAAHVQALAEPFDLPAEFIEGLNPQSELEP
jgi:hypothetical protein